MLRNGSAQGVPEPPFYLCSVTLSDSRSQEKQWPWGCGRRGPGAAGAALCASTEETPLLPAECRLRCAGQTGCAPARGITKPRFKGSSYLAAAAHKGNRKHLTEGDAAKIRKLSRGHKFPVSCLQAAPQPGLGLCPWCRSERVHGVMAGPAVMGGTHTDRAQMRSLICTSPLLLPGGDGPEMSCRLAGEGRLCAQGDT